MRNAMIHGYDEVVDEVLWDVATKAFYRTDLDGLKIVEEIDPPGVVWAGGSHNDAPVRSSVGIAMRKRLGGSDR